MNIKFTGWNAILVAVLAIGFIVFKLNIQTQSLQTDGMDEVKRWLLLESGRAVLPDMKKALENPSKNAEYLTKMAKALQDENIEIVSVTRHGTGDRIVARVEIKYQGESPSEEMNVRYLRMTYSMVTGWRVERETSAFNYYMAAFGG